MSDKHSKTEKPTAKRKGEARKKGTIPKTPELSAWAGLLIVTFLLPATFHRAQNELSTLLMQMQDAIAYPSVNACMKTLRLGLTGSINVVLPLVLVMMVIGVIGNIAQVGFMLTFQPMKPKWDRLNPMSGMKRIFSPQGLYMLAKEAAKLSVFAFLAWKIMKGVSVSLAVGGPYNLGTMIASLSNTALVFLRDVAAVGLVLALADYAMSRRRTNKSLMMTKQEVKDEMKQTEGSPQVKQEVRKRMMEATVNRMMSAMRTADVIVTNPTHYAVAIKYEASIGAPKVVAKGKDVVAQRIRELGEECRVPLVEDPPLARTLYRLCDVNDEIPRILFEAVARLLAFIYSLKASGSPMIYGVSLRPPQPFLAQEIMERPKKLRSEAGSGVSPGK